MARQKCEVHCGPGSGFEEIDASAFVSPLISPAQNTALSAAREQAFTGTTGRGGTVSSKV